MTPTRAIGRMALAAIVASVALASGAAQADPAMSPAPLDHPLVNPAGAPVLISSERIKLLSSIEATARADIFGQIREFDTLRNLAELEDGRYATWGVTYAYNAQGHSYLTGVGTVKAGATPLEVGILNFRGRPPAVPVPASVPCDVIDANNLATIPRSPFKFVAACRINSAKGQTELVLFNPDGQHRTLGFHPLRVAQIGARAGLHAAGGPLVMITSPGPDGRIYIQDYQWDPA